jgi:hypothetical protein
MRYILRETRCGEVFRGSDVKGIARFITDLMDHKRQRNAAMQMTKYTWPSLAKDMDSILRSHTSGIPRYYNERSAEVRPQAL